MNPYHRQWNSPSTSGQNRRGSLNQFGENSGRQQASQRMNMNPNQGYQNQQYYFDTYGNRHPNMNKSQNINRQQQSQPQFQQPQSHQSHPMQTQARAVNRMTVDNKAYCCPKCRYPYECIGKMGNFFGRIPLVLNCNHTMCQTCLEKSFRENCIKKVTCSICNQDSVTKKYVENLQELFLPNFYLLGIIVWCKQPPNLNSPNKQITLVATGVTLKNKKDTLAPSAPIEVLPGEQCCFHKCPNKAEIRCLDCSDIYCFECCTQVHKSAKAMRSHKTVPITQSEFSIELGICAEHQGMELEFMCRDCDVQVCCYCYLHLHEGHARESLIQLEDGQLAEMKMYQGKAEYVLKQLMISQKKLTNIQKTDHATEVDSEISQYFSNFHAKLHTLEKHLRNQANTFKTEGKSIGELTAIVQNSIDQVKQFLICSREDQKRINRRGLLEKLKDIDSTPCRLLETNESDNPIRFTVDSALDNINEMFKIHSKSHEYVLATVNDMPPDVELDMAYDSEVESILSLKSEKTTTSSRISVPPSGQSDSSSKATIKRNNHKHKLKKASEMGLDKVSITHLESLEGFYVFLKKNDREYRELMKNIKDFVQHASRVEAIELNETYLGLYQTKNEQCWSRVIVTEIISGNNQKYEVQYIDTGRSGILERNQLREISDFLKDQKPFCMRCRLYNPALNDWSKQAHLTFAKMIDKKEIYMSEKSCDGGIHTVELMIASSDGASAPIIDLLIHGYTGMISSSEESSNTSLTERPMYTQSIKLYSNNTKFTIDQTENIKFAYVKDPHNIYIHLIRNNAVLTQLTSRMKKHYRQSKYEGFFPLEGTYVAVEVKDKIRGSWHRAYVKKVYAENKADVLLVDWGVTATVPWSKVRILHESFTKIDIQAIQVKMAHITPFGGSKKWDHSAIDFLLRYYQIQDNLKMIVHSVDPTEVALFEEYATMDICVNAKMVSENVAESSGKISLTREWPHVIEKKEDSEYDLLNSIMKKMDVGENEDSDEDCVESYPGTPQQITISNLVNPDCIYVKFVKNSEKQDAFYSELQAFYLEESARKTRTVWNPKEYCAAFHKAAKQFCRACVLEDLGNGKYKVFLIDEGKECTVLINQMFEIDDYFSKSIYSLAPKVCLANIKPAGDTGKWPIAAIEVLDKIFKEYPEIYANKDGKIEDKSMPMVMFYKKTTGGTLPLEPTQIKYISINNLLVKMGLAYRKNVVKAPKVEPSAPSTAIATKLEAEKPLAVDEPEPETKQIIIEDVEDWLEPFKIQKTEFNAWITFADTNGTLLLHDEDLHELYKNLEKSLKDYFDSEDKDSLNQYKHKLTPGKICTIHWTDGNWYRGKIIKEISPEMMQVVMVDFGSDHEIHIDNLYSKVLFADIQPFATRIKFYKLFPKSGTWITSDHDLIMDNITEYANIVIKSSPDDDIPEAEVYLDDGRSLNKLLAIESKNLTRKLYNRLEEEEDAIIIEEPEEIECITATTSSVDTEILETYQIAPFPAKVYKEPTKMAIVNVISYDKVVLNFILGSKDHVMQFEKMNIDIQKSADTLEPLTDIGIDKPCISLYAEDGVWYRAKIYSVEDLNSGCVLVYFVDYGNIESVFISDLKVMKPEWLKFPVHTYIAKLALDVENKAHVIHVHQFMKKLIDKVKYVNITKKDPLTVHIYNDNVLLYYQALIDKGLITDISRALDVSD